MGSDRRPDLIVDGRGLLCVRLLLLLRARIGDVPAGTLVHVIVTDPAAPLDLPAWCELVGHTYLGRIADTDLATHGLRVTARPRPTRPGLPWQPVVD